MNEYQELRPKELNLADLVFYCLEKWRWIIGSMLIFAILAGSYKYLSMPKTGQSVQQLPITAGDETQNKDTETNLTGYHEQAIKELEDYMDLQEDYLNNSVVMQLDPYHISAGTLTYSLECDEDTGNLLTAYSTYVSGGGIAKELHSIDNSISVEDLQTLIKFDSNMLYSLDVGDAKTLMKSNVFQIQIRLPEGESCEEYLKRMEELMSGYALKLQTEVGAHKLILLDSVQSEITDTELQEYQSTIRSAYTTSAQSLYTLKIQADAILSNAETNKPIVSLNTTETGTTDTKSSVADSVSSALKYAAVGLVLGAGLAIFVLIIVYIMGGKLQNMEDFDAEFEMPLLGTVRDSEGKRKIFRFIDDLIFRLKEGTYAKIGFQEQIKMAAANVEAAISRNSTDRSLKNVMLAGTMAERDAAVLCGQLSAEIRGAVLSSYVQIVFQSSALKDLGNYDGILFLEKKGVSDTGRIMQEKKLASDRDVKVLGAIVLV